MLTIEVVTPTKRMLTMEADEVTMTGELGQIGVLPGHIPMVTTLAPGVLNVRKGSQLDLYFVAGGVAQIDHDKITILAEGAETKAEIDAANAEASRQDAEKKLLKVSFYEETYAETHNELRRAQARLDISRR